MLGVSIVVSNDNCILDRVQLLIVYLKKEVIILSVNQILPGKVEFSYLPINAQTVVLLPLQLTSLPGSINSASSGALILAANRAKVFKLSDLTRLKAAAAVAQATLSFKAN